MARGGRRRRPRHPARRAGEPASPGRTPRGAPRPEARASARREPTAVRLLALDVDGVLTDGTLLYGPEGEIIQGFCIYDGYGIACLQTAGIEVLFLTAKSFPALVHRARAVGVKRVVQGAADKAEALEEIARQSGMTVGDVGFVGDDFLDLGAIRAAGWSAAPANARPEIRAEVDYVCDAFGGEGAVREVAEVILRARDAWPPIPGPA